VQKNLEDAFHALTQRNAVQRQFIYMISHDLREPVNSICNYTGELQQHHAEALDPAGRRYLGFVREGGLRMRLLLDDLLEYIRLDGHGMKPVEVDLDALLDEVVADLSGAVTAHGAHIERGRLGQVAGDRTLLRLLFQNLLSNALKFHAPGARPLVELRAVRSATSATVTVRDNGIGIPLAQQDKLFGLFKRLNPRRHYEGTGLGLATCKRIVEMHGGGIGVQSEPGRGSVFSVELPLSIAAAEQGEGEA